VFVALFVILFLSLADRIATNAGFGFELPGLLPDGITVIGGICHDVPGCPGLDLIEQHLGLRSISLLTGGQKQMHQLPASAHDTV
jgi:hypothetical protein